MQQRRDERSLGELFSELTHELTTLVRQEVALAKTEMSQKASRVGMNVGFLAAGGAVAYAGFLAILAGVVILLAEAIPTWLSALIVGVVVAAVGGFLVQKGLSTLRSMDLVPRETVETLKEDAEWTKRQVR